MQIICFNAFSVVGNLDFDRVEAVYLLDGYCFVIAAIVNGVVDEIVYDLLNFYLVAVNLCAFIGNENELVASLFAKFRVAFNYASEKLRNIKICIIQFLTAAFKL